MKKTFENILEVKDLSVRFDSETIIQKLSFSLPRGESLAIIGPNGSGKTVLLKSLLGMIRYEGIAVFAPGTRIGYVPQKIEADKHLPLTFTNLLGAKADVLSLDQEAIRKTVAAVGLSHQILETPVGHLSGGQFQRCLIAFALLGEPNLLLLDEPTASIDQSGEEQMYELIHRLQKTYDLSIMLVSHDLSFVYRYATKVLCLNRKSICFGTPRETLDSKTLEKLYGATKYYKHEH